MKPTRSKSTPLVSELLVLRDGSVLAYKLTPAMAAALEGIHLVPDTRTQRRLIAGRVDKTVVDCSRERETEGPPCILLKKSKP